jgi:hypothetical protein
VLICRGGARGDSHESTARVRACTLHVAWQASTAPGFQHAGVQPVTVETPNASTASLDALTLRMYAPPVLSQALAASAYVSWVAASAATRARSTPSVPPQASTTPTCAPAGTSTASWVTVDASTASGGSSTVMTPDPAQWRARLQPRYPRPPGRHPLSARPSARTTRLATRTMPLLNASGSLYQPPPPPPPELPPPPPPPEPLELGAETPEAIPAAATPQEAMAPAPPN